LRKASAVPGSIELTAVLVAVTDEEPRVLTIEGGRGLPSGPFASSHRSLQMAARSWVEHHTGRRQSYGETFTKSLVRTMASGVGRANRRRQGRGVGERACVWRIAAKRWMPRCTRMFHARNLLSREGAMRQTARYHKLIVFNT
jgi:hypothetical protein